MGDGKGIAGKSWDVAGDIETVQQKWAEFTTALRYAPWPSTDPSEAWLSWVRPETEGESESITFKEITPETTRVTVAVRYAEDDLREEGVSFADAARRLDRDMALFTDYVEGRLPKDWPTRSAS